MTGHLEILKFPDSRLRNKGQEVKEVTPELAQLARDMLDIMYKENGVGLAAIQVNQPVRLFVADTSIRPEDMDLKPRYDQEQIMGDLEKSIQQPLVFFNPQILNRSGEVVFKEGCLSFPNYFAEVKRSALVEVKALDIQGQPWTLKTDGLLSICIQHEIDHLDGKLFIDHLSPVRAQKLREKIEKYGYPTKKSRKTS